jgi:hypothetical protein
VSSLLHFLLPINHPTPFLRVAGLCFVWSGVGAVLATLVVRLTFRRGKGIEDL